MIFLYIQQFSTEIGANQRDACISQNLLSVMVWGFKSLGWYHKEICSNFSSFNIIDDLMASGIKQANIIHGYGTGVIRELVQSYLKNNKNISSYRYGGENEGGFGVTVVTLK